jgi:cobalt-zinc-cadmium efflux system membrane fusion protein
VIRLGGDDVLFVRTGPETFEARVVELGVFNGARYLVRSGIAAGDDVVVQGVFLLKSALVTGESEEE